MNPNPVTAPIGFDLVGSGSVHVIGMNEMHNPRFRPEVDEQQMISILLTGKAHAR